MPPKVKITKQDIIDAAVDIIRADSVDALCARTVAARLSCSTQPIFSNFSSMDDLFFAVLKQADAIYEGFLEREMQSGVYPVYKASGMGYIRFAKEEKELFKLLFMRNRFGEGYPENEESTVKIIDIIKSNTGLNDESARLFHLESWALVHGIATMFATGYLDIEWELVSRMLTDSYLGLRKQYGLE